MTSENKHHKKTSEENPTGIHSFSPIEVLKQGFKLFKENLVAFLKLGAILLILNIISGMLTGGEANRSPFMVILSLVISGVSILIQIGMTKIILDIHDGKKLNLEYLYKLYPLFVRYLGASIIYGVAVVIGLILLIIPGIIIAIKFQFYSFLIVDKNEGIIDSLKKSAKLTEGHMMNLFILGVLLIIINLVGAMLLGLGLLVTIPTSVMAMVYVYRKLS